MLVPCKSADEQCRAKDCLEDKILCVRQPMVENKLLTDTDDDGTEGDREKPTAMSVEVFFQVDSIVAEQIGKDQSGHHINKDNVEQDHSELEECPVVPISQSEH